MENKTSKYLKYAIGEIILVVIGILIALQINNWNEDRKDIKRESGLLTYALETLKTDSLSIDSIITRTDRILKVHENLIRLSKKEILPKAVGNIDLIRASEPNVLITKKNSPNLPNEVKKLELKKVILDYFLATEWLEYTILNNNAIIEQSVRPFLAEKKLLNYGNQIQTDLTRLNLINDEKFFEAFKEDDIQQILFEAGLKLNIMRMNAQRTLEKNYNVQMAVKSYLKQND
ncbi:DUF6090 family protein [Aegicerativicinus sediminis]|uniref:DUF6090 family protein n=1 Tax=Aegicerativicinus sediminis TaxID=2893202 RepID=UPI001E6060BD|nr:DUF6090 family protein [Aegicerativicinus sediminis]